MRTIRPLAIFTGRISRSSYWIGFAAIVVVFGLGRYLLKLYLEPISSHADLIVVLWSALAAVPLTVLSVKRFHDRDWPGWIGCANGAATALFMIAPYFGYLDDLWHFSPIEHLVFLTLLPLSLFALVENGFLRGTQGSNRYGPAPGGQPG